MLMHEAPRMPTHNLLLLAGDGIGPEVMAEVKRIIAFFNKKGPDKFGTEEALVGGSCYDAHGVAVTDATMEKAKAADAIIFGAVGGPKWDKVPYDVRPEAGLLRLRKDLDLYANVRPAIVYPALADSSSLKREVVEGLDINAFSRSRIDASVAELRAERDAVAATPADLALDELEAIRSRAGSRTGQRPFRKDQRGAQKN